MPTLTSLLASSMLAVPQGPAPVPPASVHLDAPLRYAQTATGLQPPTLDGGFTEVEVFDVDADGHPDLLSVGDHGSPFVNTNQHGIMVWFGNGRGGFAVHQVGNFGYGGVAAGDVNGDGLVDVGYGIHHDYASVDLGDQILEVALGDGTGRAWTAWDDGLATNGESWGMAGTAFADFDADGDLDVASVSFGCCAGLHVYLNQGDGTWVQSFGFLGGNSSSDLLVDDVDRDGRPDLIAGHQNGIVWLGDGSGGFTNADQGLPTSALASGFDVADLDGDGTLELLLARGGVQVWGRGGGVWQRRTAEGLPTRGGVERVAAADLEGDGVPDVLAFGGGLGVAFRGDGLGSFRPVVELATPSPGNAEALRLADVDHNGRPDVVLVADEGPLFGRRNVLRLFREASRPLHLSVRVTRPSRHRVVRAGAVGFVEWASAWPAGTSAVADLALSTAGPGGPWTPVASAVPDNGRHQWTVPATPSADCWLRVTVRSASDSVANVAGPFEIR